MQKQIHAVAILGSLLAGVAFAQDVQQTWLPQDHPVLGTWRIDLRNGCFEEYTLHPKGRKRSLSGEERRKAVVEISERPSFKGVLPMGQQDHEG